MKLVKHLVRWFTVFGVVFLTVTGCGKGDDAADTLRVSVRIPEGETTDVFWFGVQSKLLQVTHEGEKSSRPWAPGQNLPLELKEGDEIVFLGLDKEGRLLVTGEAKVEKAKLVSIPLRRVL